MVCDDFHVILGNFLLKHSCAADVPEHHYNINRMGTPYSSSAK